MNPVFSGFLSLVRFQPAGCPRGGSQSSRPCGSSAGCTDFVPHIHPAGFKVEQVERGTVVFGSRPQMRWQYTRPEAKTFVFRRRYLGSTFPRRSSHGPRLGEKEKREIPFVTLSDAAELNKPSPSRAQARIAVVSEIRPRKSAAIREITASVDRSSKQIRSLAYTDSQGNRTVFEFSNYRKAPQSELVFRFTPAPGVDVIQSQ